MPDPERKTISATQAPALFNASPYLTKFMLYHQLKGSPVPRTETDRMRWGTKMQPLVLEQVQEDLKLDVNANFSNRYVRSEHGPLGYTSDATIWCPDRGPGTVEAKCVFDFGVWFREWDAGKRPPRHHEIQLQHQLTVGDGQQPFGWGVIAAWVCGTMFYFERKRDDQMSALLIDNAVSMFLDLNRGNEPDPFGVGIEAPILNELFKPVPEQVLDLRGDANAGKWAELAVMWQQFKKDENFYAKAATDARDRLRSLIRNNETVLLPNQVTLKASARTMKEHVRRAASWTDIKVLIGEDDEQAPEELDNAL